MYAGPKVSLLISDRFFWVRAQIDYLRRLPNDTEKRKALKTLPPDLWQTYIRILETIDSTYPEQTIAYIQQILKWLVLDNGSEKSDFIQSWRSGARISSSLTAELLCQALCIENDDEWPTDEATPTMDDIVQWLGCLVRLEVGSDADGAKIVQLSHFTIKEFLVLSPEKISSSTARKYLVVSHDYNYIDHICLKYVMHSRFGGIACPSPAAVEDFLSKHPLYRYVAWRLCARPWDELQGNDFELLRKFLSVPTSRQFELWDSCATYMADNSSRPRRTHLRIPSPLHFAAVTGLAKLTQRLLDEGADPNTKGELESPEIAPFHLAIISGSKRRFFLHRDTLVVDWSGRSTDDHSRYERQRHSLRVAEILVDSGARVGQQLNMFMEVNKAGDFYLTCFTPLTLALVCNNYHVANLLLRLGADLKATAKMCPAHMIDICSVESLLQEFNKPRYDGYVRAEEAVQNLVELSKHEGLQKVLEGWRVKNEKRKLGR